MVSVQMSACFDVISEQAQLTASAPSFTFATRLRQSCFVTAVLSWRGQFPVYVIRNRAQELCPFPNAQRRVSRKISFGSKTCLPYDIIIPFAEPNLALGNYFGSKTVLCLDPVAINRAFGLEHLLFPFVSSA